MLSLRLCSSLEKIFLEGPIPSHPWEKASCLGGGNFPSKRWCKRTAGGPRLCR